MFCLVAQNVQILTNIIDESTSVILKTWGVTDKTVSCYFAGDSNIACLPLLVDLPR